MNIIPFIVHSAADAVEQIHRRLGPDAVIVSVRKVPSTGLARLWKKYGRIEVLAGVPDGSESPAQPAAGVPYAPLPLPAETPAVATESAGFTPAKRPRSDADQRRAEWLERMGLLPLHVQKVLDHLDRTGAPSERGSMMAEFSRIGAALHSFWRPLSPLDEAAEGAHIFIGPPGSGKTTALCKWLTQTVLVQGRPARVWRLDGARANTAESLSVYCEILGVPEEREWKKGSDTSGEGRLFVDLPGVDVQDRAAVDQLAALLAQFSAPKVHLVLNAAYEAPLLLTQTRALARLPIGDLILTHLDEETRWGKLWNLVLGTNFTIRFLSAGQNIPGDFRPATPELLSRRVFPASKPDSAPVMAAGGGWQRIC